MTTEDQLPTTLDLLRSAVRAKQAYWDAVNALEVHYYGDTNYVPDDAEHLIHDTVEDLAIGPDNAAGVTKAEADELDQSINRLNRS